MKRLIAAAVLVGVALLGGFVLSSSATAGGKANTTVTIQGGGSVSGYVKSSNEQKCANGREVKVYRVKNNGDKSLVGTDTASPNGDKYQWAVGNPGNGKYFAQVKETAKCEGDKSKTVKN